jgi:hypothetical protein
MTHKRARFFLTLFGVLAPCAGLAACVVIFMWAPLYGAIGALLIIMSALPMMAGQAGFSAATLFWKCGECDQRYFAFMMPYWLFDRSCQNCCLPD